MSVDRGPRSGARRVLSAGIGALRSLGLHGWVKRTLAPVLYEQLEQIPEVASGGTVARTERALEEIAKSGRPIVVGPWLSEIGFEVLYWIPFVQWACDRYGLAPERLVAVSRGGTEPWYRNVASRYVEIFDAFPPAEFKRRNEERQRLAGVQKHVEVGEFDEAIIAYVKEQIGAAEVDLLHPSLMYELFRLYWTRRYSTEFVERFTRFVPFAPLRDEELLEGLPEEYVAVKFYFSEAFPNTEGNRALVRSTLTSLSAKTGVVLLDTGLDVDDHSDAGASLPGVVDLKARMTPADNLAIQTRAIARAKAFVGTYGGFSYLAPYYDVPSVAIYSAGDRFLPVHLDIAYRAVRTMKWGSFDSIKRDPASGGTLSRASFLAVDAGEMDILGLLY